MWSPCRAHAGVLVLEPERPAGWLSLEERMAAAYRTNVNEGVKEIYP